MVVGRMISTGNRVMHFCIHHRNSRKSVERVSKVTARSFAESEEKLAEKNRAGEVVIEIDQERLPV